MAESALESQKTYNLMKTNERFVLNSIPVFYFVALLLLIASISQLKQTVRLAVQITPSIYSAVFADVTCPEHFRRRSQEYLPATHGIASHRSASALHHHHLFSSASLGVALFCDHGNSEHSDLASETRIYKELVCLFALLVLLCVLRLTKLLLDYPRYYYLSSSDAGHCLFAIDRTVVSGRPPCFAHTDPCIAIGY